jgi:uncharacterized protein (TIGR00266 family)
VRYEIQYQPSYALAIIHLDSGERFRAEAGAMVSMDESIQIETKATGGIGAALKRSILGGESLFMNDMVATQDDSRLTVAPALPGDIFGLELAAGQDLLVQSGSYLASTPDVTIDTQFGKGKTIFAGEGLFLLKLTGPGTVLLSSYGAIVPLDLAVGQNHVVDTGHMVAFDSTMDYDVRKAGNSWKTTMLGGEGLVMEVKGPGRFYFQTRSPGGFLDWLIPKLPRQNSNN